MGLLAALAPAILYKLPRNRTWAPAPRAPRQAIWPPRPPHIARAPLGAGKCRLLQRASGPAPADGGPKTAASSLHDAACSLREVSNLPELYKRPAPDQREALHRSTGGGGAALHLGHAAARAQTLGRLPAGPAPSSGAARSGARAAPSARGAAVQPAARRSLCRAAWHRQRHEFGARSLQPLLRPAPGQRPHGLRRWLRASSRRGARGRRRRPRLARRAPGRRPPRAAAAGHRRAALAAEARQAASSLSRSSCGSSVNRRRLPA